MRLSIGLPAEVDRDEDIRHSIALYCSKIVVRRRTLIAHVASPHDLCVLVDSLQSDRLLGLLRWINYSTMEDHP